MSRAPVAPLPHQRGGWRSDVVSEELDTYDPHDWDHDDDGYGGEEEPPSEDALTVGEFAPCGEVEGLVRDWTLWGERPGATWSSSLAQGAPGLRAWRDRIAGRDEGGAPEVDAFVRLQRIDPSALVGLPGLAVRAVCRRHGRAVAPVGSWPALTARLLEALARAPGEVVSAEVGVLAFHELVTQAPAARGREVAMAAWHEGWHPLAPWLLRHDDPGEVLPAVQGSWLALRQMREAQRESPYRVLPPPVESRHERDRERVLRLLRRGGASLRAPAYPSFSVVIRAPEAAGPLALPRVTDRFSTPVRARHPRKPLAPRADGSLVLTCRPLDPIELARRSPWLDAFFGQLLEVMAPHHVHYGLVDEHGQEQPGLITVLECWGATVDAPFEPTLCLSAVEDPAGLLGGAGDDLVALLGGVARSRGLRGGLALRSGGGPSGGPSAGEGHRVALAPADPILWKQYTAEVPYAHHAPVYWVGWGPRGRERPEAAHIENSGWVRPGGLDAERGTVRAENLAEAHRLATEPTGVVRVTSRDQAGEALGFATW